MSLSNNQPFPDSFFCDRLRHIVTRIGCVIRQVGHKELYARPCAECWVGKLQRQINDMESKQQEADNGKW